MLKFTGRRNILLVKAAHVQNITETVKIILNRKLLFWAKVIHIQLELFFNHETMFETGVVRANEC